MKKYILVIIALFYSFLNIDMLFAAQKADLGGTGRWVAAGFSIGSKGYIGTGYDGSINCKDFWEFDPNTNTWTQKADFGGTGRFSAVGFSIGSKGYIGAGHDGSTSDKDFWEFDPSTNKWTQRADFGGTGRFNAVGFTIGSKGYIGTGYDGSTYYKDFWEYDPGTDKWTQKVDFGGTGRYGAAGFSIGNKGYIGTGYDGSISYKDFWEFDPSTNTWTQKAGFGGTGRYGAAGFSIGSKGYIGIGYDGSTMFDDFWEYDPGTNIWTLRSTFDGTGRYGAVGFSIGSTGYIGTGLDGSTYYKDFWEYNPVLDKIPDQFTFTDQTNVAVGKTVTSNIITVSGIDPKVTIPISISGGTYSINGGAYTSAIGTVSNGDTVTVQQTASSLSHTTTNATLIIGGVSGTFNVTTENVPDVGSSDPFPCFIATAAFGSPMAGQVEILRQFRNRYLLTNDFGRKFVAWYYRNGPVAANFIKDKPLVKAAVRTALYPLIGFSFLLISGYLPLLIVGLLLSAPLFFRLRVRKSSDI